jgi:HSP20 family protein
LWSKIKLLVKIFNGMLNKKRSFFEKLTGSIRADDDEEVKKITVKSNGKNGNGNNWMEEENEEAELTVDVYQTATEIVIQTMIAGVKPEDLELTITRDMLTIRGKREESRIIDEENYFTKELYWGGFSRTILLPQEVEPEETEAIEKHGLLTIRLQKIDKEKRTSVKIKSA